MQKPRSWCTKTYLRKVKSTEILIRRKSLEKSSPASQEAPVPRATRSVLEIGTPQRELRIVTPDGIAKLQGSPKQRRYRSMRRIDF